jgi:hypothetical protein
MEEALEHLEKHKVFDDRLNTFVVPLFEAQQAITLSIDKQVQEALSKLEGLSEDIINLEQDND